MIFFHCQFVSNILYLTFHSMIHIKVKCYGIYFDAVRLVGVMEVIADSINL